MASLDQLLARVIERRGYTVQGADGEAIFARKTDGSLLVAWKLGAAVTAEDTRTFTQALEQVDASAGILVAPEGTEAEATEAIQGKSIEVWTESRLVLEIGRALLRDALDAPAAKAPAPTPAPAAKPPRGSGRFPSLLAQAASASSVDNRHAAYYMTSKPRAPAASGTPPPAPVAKGSGMLGYAWAGGMGATIDPGVAQVRNGRRPRGEVVEAATPDGPTLSDIIGGGDIEFVKPRRRANPGASSAGATTTILKDEDVEIITTPRRPQPSAPAEPEPAAAPAPLLPMADDEEEYEILPGRGDEKKASADDIVPEAAEPTAAEGESTTLRIGVDEEEAVKIAGKSGTARLTLVPHIAFEYDLRMDRPGMSVPLEAKGAMLASGVTGGITMLETLAYADADPKARKEPSKLHAVDVYGKVKQHLARTYTKTLRVERELAGNAVMENVKFVPDASEMNLQHKGAVMVPVWEIIGSTGIVRVNAHTGDVIE